MTFESTQRKYIPTYQVDDAVLQVLSILIHILNYMFIGFGLAIADHYSYRMACSRKSKAIYMSIMEFTRVDLGMWILSPLV